jgi:bisphosphoglycerate-independent phosphoglycerate mutase (AlkP superfamily)
LTKGLKVFPNKVFRFIQQALINVRLGSNPRLITKVQTMTTTTDIGTIEQGLSHRGIILAPQQRYEIGDLMRGVLKLINTKSPEEMQGQLEFLSN